MFLVIYMLWSDVSSFRNRSLLFLCKSIWNLQQLIASCFIGVRHLQRCRYIEAHAVHKRLNELEDLLGERCTDEAKFSRVRMASEQRGRIVVSIFQVLVQVSSRTL